MEIAAKKTQIYIYLSGLISGVVAYLYYFKQPDTRILIKTRSPGQRLW